MSHATLENVTDLSKMQILQQQVQHPHAGAPRLSGSTVLCCACRLVTTTLLLLDRTPRDFQYLLNMQWQYRLPKHTSVPQHIWVGVPGPVHHRSCSPQAASHTALGMLLPRGQLWQQEGRSPLRLKKCQVFPG